MLEVHIKQEVKENTKTRKGSLLEKKTTKVTLRLCNSNEKHVSEKAGTVIPKMLKCFRRLTSRNIRTDIKIISKHQMKFAESINYCIHFLFVDLTNMKLLESLLAYISEDRRAALLVPQCLAFFLTGA